MAEVTDVTVSYSRKVQIEKFEPVEFGVEMKVSLDDDDDREAVYRDAAADAEDMVERELARRISRKKMDAGDD